MKHSPSKAVAEAESEPPGDALRFMQLLWAVAHGLESSSKRMQSRLGVTGPQRLVLRIVGHHGRLAAGELAQILHIDPSSLTGTLRRLSQAGLLDRERDPLDGRRALLQLSTKGRRLNGQRAGTIEAAVAGALSKMSREQVGSAKVVLKAIAAALAKPPGRR